MMINDKCSTPLCKITGWWSHQPGTIQNTVILIISLLTASVIIGIASVLGIGETEWTWHITG